MVALNDNLPQDQECGCRGQGTAEHFVPLCPAGKTDSQFVGRCSLTIERIADAYGNTLIFTAPDSSSNWWSDAAVQSNYGANEIIYCGYRYDPEGPGYYVRNRNYMPFLGRWIQRDPIGYSGGINLYDYVGGRAVVELDPMGTFIRAGIPGPALFYASCDDAFGVSDKWGFVGCAWCPGDIDPVGAGCVASCCYTYNSGMACDFLGCFADCVEANGCNGCWIDVIL
jgi:RHS repeat-associated protein